MQHQDINDYVKEKFIFVYDRRLLRHLRANNHRYLVEAINLDVWKLIGCLRERQI